MNNNENRRTLEHLQADVINFFNHGQNSATDSANINSEAMSILEVACLGNPEKTLQGELLYYLRSRNWNIVQEAGYVHVPLLRRNLDFIVFDAFGSAKAPLCVVELKHYSANQSNQGNLIKGLDRDCTLVRPAFALMQIGLYTVVTKISPLPGDLPVPGHGLHRFLSTYCSGKMPPKNSFFDDMQKWSAQSKLWQFSPYISSIPAKQDSFQTSTGLRVEGYVQQFVGIRAM